MRRLLTTAGFLALLGIAMGASAARHTASAMPLSSGFTVSVARVFDCPGQCLPCSFWPDVDYEVFPASEEIPGNDSDTETACGHHVPCDDDICNISFNDVFQQAVRVVAENDELAFRALFSRLDNVRVDGDRKALLLMGCTGVNIMAVLPLNQQEMAVALEGWRKAAADRATAHQ